VVETFSDIGNESYEELHLRVGLHTVHLRFVYHEALNL